MTRAAIYVRISSDPEGLRAGVERQEKECRELCERRGWTVAAVHADNDISAFSGKKRPSYDRLLEQVRSGEVDAVVAWASDRLYRDMRDLEDFVDVVERAGAAVATVAGGDLDLSTSEGRMIARIHGAVARQESERKAERLRSWAADRAAKGHRAGGARPFGYETDGASLRPHPVEAPLVAEAARRVLLGEPVRSICAQWNREGVRTVRGGFWTYNGVLRTLVSPRIAGLREHLPRARHEANTRGTDLRRLGTLTEAAWPALVPRETWEALRAMLLDEGRRSPGRPPDVGLLIGIATCGTCGTRLRTGRRIDGTRQYICPPIAGISRKGEGHVARAAEPLEEFVLDNLPEGPWSLRPPLGREDLERMEALGAEASRQRLRLGRIAEAYEQGDYSLAEYRSRKADAERLLRRAEEGLADLRPESRALDPEEVWEELPFERRRALLAELFEEVRVLPVTRGRKGFDRRAVELYTKGGDRLITF